MCCLFPFPILLLVIIVDPALGFMPIGLDLETCCPFAVAIPIVSFLNLISIFSRAHARWSRS
jgi:hypothetical protein